MSVEQNKVIARRVFEDIWNQGRLDVVDELFDANFVGYDPAVPTPTRGVEGYKQYVMMYHSAFPDEHFTVEDVIAEGDKVVVRFTSHGTQQGPLLGIPPTDKAMTVTGIVMGRIANGKIVEVWLNYDALGMLHQLGVIPISV